MNKEWYFKESEKVEPTESEIKYANRVFNKWKDVLTSKDKYKYSFLDFKKYALIQLDEDIEREILWEFSEVQPTTHQVLSACRVRKVIEELKQN